MSSCSPLKMVTTSPPVDGAHERLARDGHAVVLLERDQVGAHASGAAAGLLAPHSELPGDELGSRSARLFPDLVERIDDPATRDSVHERALELCRKFPIPYAFD